MLKRLDLAASNNYDGVDSDNINGFKSESSFNITRYDAIDYVSFLSDAAHTRIFFYWSQKWRKYCEGNC